MKLLDKVFDRSLEAAKPFKALAQNVGVLARELNNLGVAVLHLAQTVNAHTRAIQELYALNGALLRSMKENSIDMKLPENKDKASKPN